MGEWVSLQHIHVAYPAVGAGQMDPCALLRKVHVLCYSACILPLAHTCAASSFLAPLVSPRSFEYTLDSATCVGRRQVSEAKSVGTRS